MGTAPFAAVSLRALAREADLEILTVVTQPDRPKGRDLTFQPSAVKLAALEKLSDTECTAFILREAFDYPYREIANVLCLEEANARQLVLRARRHVATPRKRRTSSPDKRRLLDAFMVAAQSGDIAGLLSQPASLSGH